MYAAYKFVTLVISLYFPKNNNILLVKEDNLFYRSESDEGLTLEKSAFESPYGGQFTLSTQLIKPNYLVTLPPTQHHSFF